MIMILFQHWCNQYPSQLDPGVEISYDILPPPPPPPPPNNQLQSFVCILYLLDKIHHYKKIISMISWIVKMLLFWHYQKVSQLDPGVKILYDILTPSPLDIFTPLK